MAPVPWDLGASPASQDQQREYRQTFMHDAERTGRRG
jgi:hypothetical protein